MMRTRARAAAAWICLSGFSMLAYPQEGPTSSPPPAPPLLVHLAQDEMSAADTAIAARRQAEIASEARFYGYNLKTGEWAYRETTSPFLPNDILLTYDERLPSNVTSRFVALVPRGSGRVHIVPAIIRGALPLGKPYDDPRNFGLFNQAVSQDMVKKVLSTDIGWLGLGAAYAAMVGGDPVVPREGEPETGNRAALVRLNTSETTRVVVPDRSAEKGYTVWTVDFAKSGTVIAADREDHWSPAPYLARTPSGEIKPAVRVPADEPRVVKRAPVNEARPVANAPAETPSPTPHPAAEPSSEPQPVPQLVRPGAGEDTPAPVAPDAGGAAGHAATPVANFPAARPAESSASSAVSAPVSATPRVIVVKPPKGLTASDGASPKGQRPVRVIVHPPNEQAAGVHHRPAKTVKAIVLTPEPEAAPVAVTPSDAQVVRVLPPAPAAQPKATQAAPAPEPKIASEAAPEAQQPQQ
jgi:hypothetical protein